MQSFSICNEQIPKVWLQLNNITRIHSRPTEFAWVLTGHHALCITHNQVLCNKQVARLRWPGHAPTSQYGIHKEQLRLEASDRRNCFCKTHRKYFNPSFHQCSASGGPWAKVLLCTMWAFAAPMTQLVEMCTVYSGTLPKILRRRKETSYVESMPIQIEVVSWQMAHWLCHMWPRRSKEKGLTFLYWKELRNCNIMAAIIAQKRLTC